MLEVHTRALYVLRIQCDQVISDTDDEGTSDREQQRIAAEQVPDPAAPGAEGDVQLPAAPYLPRGR